MLNYLNLKLRLNQTFLVGALLFVSCSENERTSEVTPQFPTHVSDNMTNCYMVAPGQSVTFPVSRAYIYDDVFTNTLHTGGEYTGAFGVEVAWQDVTNLVTPSIVSGTGKDTQVKVQVNGSTQGNAVVKIYKASDTSKTPVWSYHIWVTDYTGSDTWTNPNQTAYTFMDRNLGATEAKLSLKGRGLLYQWGRKDPFPGGMGENDGDGVAGYAALDKFYGMPDAGSTDTETVSGPTVAAGIVQSIQHPTTFYKNVARSDDWLPYRKNDLWDSNGGAGGNKTIYDPCPSGWRVPARVQMSTDNAYSPWYGLSKQSFTSGDTGGYNCGTNALYPAAGYRRENSGSPGRRGEGGYYWSASPYNSSSGSDSASYLDFYSGYVDPSSRLPRAEGHSVRCVKE